MKKKSFVSLLLALILLVSSMCPTAFASTSAIMDNMKVKATAAYLVNMDSDKVLFSQNGEERICPASITKVMTALLVLESIERGEMTLKDKIKAYDDCWEGLDYTSSNQNIRPGEKMRVNDLLYCLLVASANEAANILAERVSGSIADFVKLMNQRAKELGCTDTHFVNPHGMPDDDHYTTCADLYLIAKAAMSYGQFRDIVSTDEYYVDKTNLSERRHFFNTNGLITNKKYAGYEYSHCIGIKTGTTDKGGYNLLAAAEKDGKTLISVVIGCQPTKSSSGFITSYTQFTETTRLLEWGFDSFATITVIDSKDAYGQIPVTLSYDADSVAVAPEHSIVDELPKDVTPESFKAKPTLLESVEAPVKKGDVLGSMTLYLDGEEYDTVNLIAVTDVNASTFLKRKAALKKLFDLWYVKALLGVILLLIVVVILRLTLFRPRRRYGRSYGGRRAGGYRGGRRW